MQQGPSYTAVGAILCFVAAALTYDLEWFFSEPWRVATVVFCLAVLVVQLGSNFLAPNPSGIIVASTIVNGILFVALLGVLLSTAKEMVSREDEEEEEEERETKKKKLTYEI